MTDYHTLVPPWADSDFAASCYTIGQMYPAGEPVTGPAVSLIDHETWGIQ